MYTYMYIYICMYIYMYTYLFTHLYTYVYIYESLSLSLSIFLSLYTYIYTYIYIRKSFVRWTNLCSAIHKSHANVWSETKTPLCTCIYTYTNLIGKRTKSFCLYKLILTFPWYKQISWMKINTCVCMRIIHIQICLVS